MNENRIHTSLVKLIFFETNGKLLSVKVYKNVRRNTCVNLYEPRHQLRTHTLTKSTPWRAQIDVWPLGSLSKSAEYQLGLVTRFWPQNRRCTASLRNLCHICWPATKKPIASAFVSNCLIIQMKMKMKTSCQELRVHKISLQFIAPSGCPFYNPTNEKKTLFT